MEGADCQALRLTLPAQLQCSRLEFGGCIAGKGNGTESAGFVFREKPGGAHGEYAGFAGAWTRQDSAMPFGTHRSGLVWIQLNQRPTLRLLLEAS